MNFSRHWKINWELKSLNYFELHDLVIKVIKKQLDDLEDRKILISDNLITDYDADSVDIVAILLSLEDLFKTSSENTRIVVPTDKLGQIVYVDDLIDLMYEALLDVEKKMETFEKLVPNLDALDKQKKIGEFYN
jgi:acyl carrier protein